MLNLLNRMRETAAARMAVPSDSVDKSDGESDAESEADEIVKNDDFFVQEYTVCSILYYRADCLRIPTNSSLKDCISSDLWGTSRCNEYLAVRGTASLRAPDRYHILHEDMLHERTTADTNATTPAKYHMPLHALQAAQDHEFAEHPRQSPLHE